MKKLLALVLALVMTLGLATVGANAALSDYTTMRSTPMFPRPPRSRSTTSMTPS